MSALNMKRIPGFVDAGGTSVETTYIGKSVSRKVIGKRADGTPIYQDTNNSTNDFQVNDTPAIRRDSQKIPTWSRANAL
jgi:predicted ABC-type ATPase